MQTVSAVAAEEPLMNLNVEIHSNQELLEMSVCPDQIPDKDLAPEEVVEEVQAEKDEVAEAEAFF